MLLVAASVMAGDYSTSMTPIMKDAEKLVTLMEDEHDLEIVRMEYDILRTSKTTTRVLSKDWTYMIVAFGDFRFKDIDVKVYRQSSKTGNWILVAHDEDESDTAIVTVTPEYDQEYLIEISAYQFNSGYEVGHYGLIIAHDSPTNY